MSGPESGGGRVDGELGVRGSGGGICTGIQVGARDSIHRRGCCLSARFARVLTLAGPSTVPRGGPTTLAWPIVVVLMSSRTRRLTSPSRACPFWFRFNQRPLTLIRYSCMFSSRLGHIASTCRAFYPVFWLVLWWILRSTCNCRIGHLTKASSQSYDSFDESFCKLPGPLLGFG